MYAKYSIASMTHEACKNLPQSVAKYLGQYLSVRAAPSPFFERTFLL
jgi:hypothetical protein